MKEIISRTGTEPGNGQHSHKRQEVGCVLAGRGGDRSERENSEDRRKSGCDHEQNLF